MTPPVLSPEMADAPVTAEAGEPAASPTGPIVATPATATTLAAGATEAASPFEPLILGFTCNWCSYRAADLAGTSRTKYPPNVRLIRLMCSGRIEPEFILEGFARGADAVVMTGCWPEDCHYRIQSVKALRRFLLLRRTLTDLGIDAARVQRFYASAAEGQRFADEMARITEEVRAIGPIPPGARPERHPEGEGLLAEVAEVPA